MIVIASPRGAIRVADRATAAWYGSGDLEGASLLGLVAPDERLAGLRFIEHMVEHPGLPSHLVVRLVQRTGKVTAFSAMGALIGDSLAVQLTRNGHATPRLDESLIWATADLSDVTDSLRPLVMAMVAGALRPALPGADVVHDAVIASVSLPPGTDGEHFASTYRSVSERACFVAQMGARTVTVRSDVSGVHFGAAGMTMRPAGDVSRSAVALAGPSDEG